MTSPLMSWDISNPIFNHRCKISSDLENLNTLRTSNKWEIDFSKELSVNYQTLVLTDINQQILWVNDGFQDMTGYSPDFALGKKPSFLQGINTATEVKNRIRNGLILGERISETITNYKKNGREYECLISIIPLYDSNKRITHYLALEREVA